MTGRHALALGACTLVVIVSVGCGGDNQVIASPAILGQEADPAARDTQAEPTLDQPPVTYALTADDLEEATSGASTFAADANRTFVLDATNYGKVVSASGGAAMLTSWGYLGGYETVFVPEGRDEALLDGAYYAVLEVHLFATPPGAAMAYHHFVEKLQTTPARRMEMHAVGNESTAWTMTSGKLGNSDRARVHSSVLFRRGNLVAVILVIGAEDHVNAGTMETLATIVDARALGRSRADQAAPLATQTPR